MCSYVCCQVLACFGMLERCSVPSPITAVRQPGILRLMPPAQVLDRALLRAGGRRWWSVLLGRARAQRIWALHREGLRTAQALRRPDNYGLASRSRFGLGRCGLLLRGRRSLPTAAGAASTETPKHLGTRRRRVQSDDRTQFLSGLSGISPSAGAPR